MIIAVPKETGEMEKRVALIPDTVSKLVEKGHTVRIGKGAGAASSYPDSTYREAGAEIVEDAGALVSGADVVISIQVPDEELLSNVKKDAILICLIWALQNRPLVEKFREMGITTLALDAVPRISRAQSMDVLSSMSSIAGYKAALIAANELDRYFPMMMTAAGTIAPAKVLVLGAGVAGLQAIATCKRLGAVVEAFDIRPAVKEQVESLGAKFVEVPVEEEDTETKGGYAKELSKDSQQRQREVIHEHAKKSDIVITTALVPGKKAPILVTGEMVADMHPGSVIVDLAAEQGGNCELTQPGEEVVENEVRIIGPMNLPSSLAYHASQLYSKNMMNLLNHLLDEEGKPAFDFEDEITLNTTITHKGEIVSPVLKEQS